MGLTNAVLLHAEMKFFEAEIEYNAAKIYDSIRSHVIGTSKTSDSCCTIITNFVKDVSDERIINMLKERILTKYKIEICWATMESSIHYYTNTLAINYRYELLDGCDILSRIYPNCRDEIKDIESMITRTKLNGEHSISVQHLSPNAHKVLLENDYTVETVAMENNGLIVISWDNKDKEK